MAFLKAPKPPELPPTPVKADATQGAPQTLPSIIGGAGNAALTPPLARKAKTEKASLIGGA